MSISHAPTASVLAIGDEVLRGEVVNGNAAFLSDRLFELGFVVREHLVVSDEPGDIRAGLERLSRDNNVLVVTGGLGPTDDDRTVDVVSALLGTTPEIHGPSLAHMERAAAARGFELTPNNRRQVRVPGGAEPLPNAVGMAPGFRALLGEAEAYFFPGVPREMERILADHVLPRLRTAQTARGFPPPAVRTLHVYGMGESHIDDKLTGLAAGERGPAISIHYRTAFPENHVKLIVRGPDAAQNEAVLARLSAEALARLGPAVYGVDGESHARALGTALREAGATLALAESCTGGYAGQLVTAVSGASDYFLGAVVSYANEVKTNLLGVRVETLQAHGAVSEPCAREMAEGARRLLGATIAVSITGIAGSDEGKSGGAGANARGRSETATEGKPIGQVCFGVAGPRGTVSETKQFLPGRERVRRAAAYYALDLARRHFE